MIIIIIVVIKKERQMKLTRFIFSRRFKVIVTPLSSDKYLQVLELNSSSIKKHFNNQHDCLPDNINQHFTVLRKCKTKHDCLIYEMLYIRELSPSLNVQSDSIKAKLFV